MFELQEDLLGHVAELEGHPDNAAAALLGGFVIVTGGEVARFEPPDGLEAVIVVPRAAVRTAVARKALPEQVPMADAVANVARGALLTLGLATGDFSLIGRGLEDRLHQPYRAHLFPQSMALLRARARVRRDRRDDLRRRPDGALLDAGRRDRRGRRALRGEAEGWADVLRAPFESAGRRRARAVALSCAEARGPGSQAATPGCAPARRREALHHPAHVAVAGAQAARAGGRAQRVLLVRPVDRDPVAAGPALRDVRLAAGERERAAAVGTAGAARRAACR